MESAWQDKPGSYREFDFMTTKWNVCLMNDSFPPKIDGVSNAVMNYADIIQRKYGNAVVAVPQYPKVVDDYPFQVVRYPSFKTKKSVGYRAGYPFSASALRKLETQNIDIIHSHCPIAATLLARILRETIHVPIVLTYHTKYDIDIARAIKSERLQHAAIKGLVNNIEACDEVWVVSRGAGENLRSLGYTGEYVIMENGVDFPCGRVDEGEVAKLRSKHDIPGTCCVFLFVGRLMWYKGIRIILDGIKRAGGSGLPFKMIFIGDGTDREKIEEYAEQLGLKEYCLFTGAVQDRELLRVYFCMANLFLFPSAYDTNGIVVREAAACGLPSVVISGSCAAEGIIDGHTGIFIEENADSMAEAITNACQNKSRLKEIGLNAMNEIYISWDDSVEKAYQRYGAIIEKYARGDYREQHVKYDELIAAYADIYEGFKKARARQSKISNKFKFKIKKMMGRFDRYL